VCYFPTDIHSASLSPDGDDSLARASKGEIKGEVALIFGTQDGHVVRRACSCSSGLTPPPTDSPALDPGRHRHSPSRAAA